MHKPFDAGVFIGRFQHLHLGHQQSIDLGLKVCDRLLVMVGSSQERGTVLNPFDVSTRMAMIREVYDPRDVTVVALPDVNGPETITPAWGRHVLDSIRQHLHKAPDVFLYGNDEPRSKWFAAQADEVKNVTEMIVARDPAGISATKMRRWLFDDGRKLWMANADPRLHKHYDRLRAELLDAPAYAGLTRFPANATDKPTFTFSDVSKLTVIAHLVDHTEIEMAQYVFGGLEHDAAKAAARHLMGEVSPDPDARALAAHYANLVRPTSDRARGQAKAALVP